MGNPSQSYGASPAIWDYTCDYLLLDTSKRAAPKGPKEQVNVHAGTGNLPRRDEKLGWPWF